MDDRGVSHRRAARGRLLPKPQEGGLGAHLAGMRSQTCGPRLRLGSSTCRSHPVDLTRFVLGKTTRRTQFRQPVGIFFLRKHAANGLPVMICSKVTSKTVPSTITAYRP